VADYKLIGKNYTAPDLVAKVTGRAKYAEDFRAEGMLFTKLLLSPMPHGRVRNLDTRAALAMPGVEAILTADDLPEVEAPGEQMLTNEPLYEGEPILAIAAVTEEVAADAIEQVRMDLEPLPFSLDPLDSLRPGGANARLDGNTLSGRDILDIKWTNVDWSEVDRGTLPTDGEVTDEWGAGDIEAGFTQADHIIDETVFVQSMGHQPLETRSAMAYWQNGKCYLHVSTQSTARTHPAAARWVGVAPDDLVIIAEYCGGGFGSKITGSIQSGIPALLSKKAGKPVMMRINRQEENFIGRSRPGMVTRVRIGLRNDGRMTAFDWFAVQDGGPYGRSGDFLSAGDQGSLMYTPENIRVRGLSVYTNTPPRSAQRAPGGVQLVATVEPLMHRAAKTLGIDRLELMKINAPSGQQIFGRPREGTRSNVSSAFVREAVDKGAEAFDWKAMKAKSGRRNGSKVTGIGVALSSYSAGASGLDGLLTIRPDGKVYIQQGVGNLGTGSVFDTARAAMEALQTDWEQAEVVWGDSSKHLPWSSVQAGSQTTHAHTRANWAAGLDAKLKLQEIAARDLGGAPSDYDVADGRVFRRGNRAQGMAFARAATRAIALGGKYDGHEVPEDVNDMTKAAGTGLAGLGLMGIAKDNFETGGRNMSYAIGFAEVEVDIETGAVSLTDYAVSSDVGTVVNPRTFAGQLHGGGVQGFGYARGQKWIYDRRWGLHVSKRFYSNRPPTMLDIPIEKEMKWIAAGVPDPFNPLGARGIGEPSQGAGSGAVQCAIADALESLGEDGQFLRTPIMTDMILSRLNGLPEPHSRLATHT
jgi:xanthine dehydrogenase molybdenum-binding subunit